MSKKKKKFIILDGNALIHRSFHALPTTLATKNGLITNAVYGFTSALLKAIFEFKPDYIALTLDKKEPTFRHKQYKEYKAKRIKAPQELYDQFPLVKKIAESFEIPIYEMSGFEADDLIGTIARETDGNVEKIIVTGDMDTLQLVNDHTKVYAMSRGILESALYGSKQVKERYGLDVDQLIDYKALRGDPSDNIPGVRGIGEKTATELLQKFGTLDEVYRYVETKKYDDDIIRPRVIELLKKYKKDAYLSKELGTIMVDVDMKFNLEEARFKDLNIEKITKTFQDLEFNSLLSRLNKITKTVNQEESIEDKFERNLKLFNYNLIDTEEKFNKFLVELKKQKEFAFDTETTDFDPIQAKLLGISFSWENKHAYYLQVKSQESKVKSLLDYKNDDEEKGLDVKLLKKIKPILEDKNIKKIGHNIKYDIQVMANYDIEVQGEIFDTRVASYILNPGLRGHSLDAVTLEHFDHEKIDKKDLFPDKKQPKEFAKIPIEKMYVYSCEDADFTFRLKKILGDKLKKQKLEELFEKIEMPLVQVLAKMERNGIKVNSDFLKNKSLDFGKRIESITDKCHKLAGINFNINSTQQLREVLFDKLQLPTEGIKKGKTGFSTAASELKKLEGVHPIIKIIQENRELQKLKNTYLDAIPKLINPDSGRVHTSFNQTATATGRLSSQNPNLQNIPVRTKEGREIRRAFVAEHGFKLLAIDYSQVELRLTASISGDKKMIKAFLDGADIHTQTAAEINKVSLDNVTSEMRRQAKAINFGVLYGQGPHGLSEVANISYAEAREFIDVYFSAFNGVKKFIDQIIEKAEEKGYVETLFGRRRYLSDINSNNPQIKKAAERMAINAPIQGTAADMIKIAMAKVQDKIDKGYEKEVKMLLQVHDELIFEVKENLVEKVSLEIKEIMEQVIKLKVPIVADVKAGDNWGEMEALN
ncbi:DNA polymerase I [Candidatus Falkowbacteria bacterium]|jgi:DNA polymerase I|nr:DNA polymerase I [Candidatus Falkowbacteria bacterium]MBT4432744.1 DNA polymerase I [Candidatus Falkowbacteria bacterium]